MNEKKNFEFIVLDLFEDLVPFLFSVFDAYLPNDSSAWKEKADKVLNTAVPKYEIILNGFEIKVTCNGFELNGSPSGFLTLVGGLWGIARGKVLSKPCIRLFYELGVAIPEGDLLVQMAVKNLTEKFLHLICALKDSGIKEAEAEAEILLYEILKKLQYEREKKEYYFSILRQSFSEETIQKFGSRQDTSEIYANTRQSYIKRLALSEYFKSKNTFNRVLLVQTLFWHVHHTESSLLRVLKDFVLLLPLLDDKHPLVRDLMAETADLLVSRLFYSQAYEAILPVVSELVDRGLNMDINLARRWECYLALGRKEQAEQDWVKLKQIVKLWEPAPAQYWGLHTQYPNYDFWQLFGYLRIAKANLAWANGGDPCKFVTKKKKLLNKEMHDKLVQTAGQYISLINEKIEGLVKDCNAFEVGAIFAELQVQIADLKKQDIYGKGAKEYVMHSQYVDHLLKKTPESIEQANLVRLGLYKKIEGRHFELVEETSVVKSPQQGFAVGLEYFVSGAPLSRTVTTTINVYYKKSGFSFGAKKILVSYESVSYIGMNNAFFWSFETEEDKKVGEWTIEIILHTEQKKDLKIISKFTII